jgi:hypothetical protein
MTVRSITYRKIKTFHQVISLPKNLIFHFEFCGHFEFLRKCVFFKKTDNKTNLINLKENVKKPKFPSFNQ